MRFGYDEGCDEKIKAEKKLIVIEDGDHSFKTLKSMFKDEEEVYAGITEKCVEWLTAI